MTFFFFFLSDCRRVFSRQLLGNCAINIAIFGCSDQLPQVSPTADLNTSPEVDHREIRQDAGLGDSEFCFLLSVAVVIFAQAKNDVLLGWKKGQCECSGE